MYLNRRRGEDDTEVKYWRKANEVHRWFVENCQGGVDECQESEVTIQQLAELLDRCINVLNSPDLASEILPTQSGFFFGSTEYDQWYFAVLGETIEALSIIIDEHQEGDKYIYQSSW